MAITPEIGTPHKASRRVESGAGCTSWYTHQCKNLVGLLCDCGCHMAPYPKKWKAHGEHPFYRNGYNAAINMVACGE